MIKSKRFCSFIIVTLILTFFLTAPVYASNQHIIDNDNYLSEEDQINIEKKLSKLSDKTDTNIFIVFTSEEQYDSAKYSAKSYADDLSYNNKAKNGNIIMYVNLASRDIVIQDEGSVKDKISQKKLSKIRENVTTYLTNKNYKKACDVYIDNVENYLIKSLKPLEIIIAILIASAVGFGFYLITILRYKHAVPTDSYPLKERGSVKLVSTRDKFISKHVTRTRINTNSSSGSSGGSASSSGKF